MDARQISKYTSAAQRAAPAAPVSQIHIGTEPRLRDSTDAREASQRTPRAASTTTPRQAYQRAELEASTSGRANMNGSAHGSVTVSVSPKKKSAKPAQAEVKVDYNKLFSQEAHRRLMPGLRVLATAFNGLPDMIPVHGGLPPASAFPLSRIQLTLKDGSSIDISEPDELVAAQQYNLTMKGHPSVLDWVTEHTRRLHSPPPQHETIITSGSNYTLEMLFRLFLEPDDGILCEEFTYPHVPESLVQPAGYRSVRVEIDHNGIIPDRLEATLEGMRAAGEPVPKLLYTIPTGQNPTGATQTDERKRQIYNICRRFNIIILEDDPYYYLQYTVGEPPRGLQNLGISYLSIDTDSRVCRLDSFSKAGGLAMLGYDARMMQALAPGLRIGWLTAHSAVIDKVLFHFHGVAMGASSLSQVVAGAIVQSMGHDGFEDHIKDLQAQYARRAGIITAAAERHLAGLADWAPVTAGMFLWLRLRGFEDASQILSALQDAKVIVVPGKLARHSGPGSKTPCPYVRLSFVTAPEDKLEVAIERLADLLRGLHSGEKPPPHDVPAIPKPLDQGEVL